MSAKVTESLRKTWALQLSQFKEEREFTQDGRPRRPDSIAEIDEGITLMERLLALPLGSEIPR